MVGHSKLFDMDPVHGVEYPLHLGKTVLADDELHSYISMRYDFKPASAVGSHAPGVYTRREEQVTFQIPNVQVGAASTTFNGHYEPPKDEYDCVAVFDGTGFILERTGGQVKNLRHIRQQQKPAVQRPASPPDGPLANGEQRPAPSQPAQEHQRALPAPQAPSSRIESAPALEMSAAVQSPSEADSDTPSSHEQQDAAIASAPAEAESGSSSSSSSSSDDDQGSSGSSDDEDTAAAAPEPADADDTPGQDGLTDAEKAFWGGGSAAAASAGGSGMQYQRDHAGNWTQSANVLVEII